MRPTPLLPRIGPAITSRSTHTTGTAPSASTSVPGNPSPVDPSATASASSAVSRSGRFALRADVVVVAGREDHLALVNHDLTPTEGMLTDLMLLRDALDREGVSHLLVRGTSHRPVLAVPRAQAALLWAALRRLAAQEVFYVRATEHVPMTYGVDHGLERTWLLADEPPGDVAGADLLRVFRPRLEPVSGLRYGATWGVEIELWSYGIDDVVLPAENALTRTRIPAEELVEVEVEQYGRSWTTLEHMFTPQPQDICFDIDLVFSWVDGSDLVWQQARAEQMAGHLVGAGDDHPSRYRHLDELRYALRSVHLHAPWVRRIFVATDSPRPVWLAEHPRVTFVRSAEFFTDPTVLPTHNSMAVESQLHHIPGLAEHFIYSNDDMFFGRHVPPSLFFSPAGLTLFLDAPTRIGLGSADHRRSGFENSARVNRALLLERFGRLITRHLAHAAMPMRRSILSELEQAFPAQFAATAASPFRNAGNISVTNSLYHYYALLTGRALVQEQASHYYVDTTSRAGLDVLEQLLTDRSTDLFCLNDGSSPEVPAEVRAHAVTDFLERYFPIPAPWEHVVQPTASSSP